MLLFLSRIVFVTAISARGGIIVLSTTTAATKSLLDMSILGGVSLSNFFHDSAKQFVRQGTVKQ